MQNSIITLTDSYKFTHHKMMSKNTTANYAYWEARLGAKFSETLFFGLQYFMKEYLEGKVVTQKAIERAAQLSAAHFLNDKVFNREMWEYIVQKYNGHLPIRIRAVPEGTVVPINNVMMTVETTEDNHILAPLTNHLETLLSQVWAPTTVATLSREVKKVIMKYLKNTSTNPDAINFALHDFGFRGVSSVEGAGVLGAGHLINFLGTDTVKALEVANEYYNAPYEGLGYSVPASEHSVMTAHGRAGEADIVDLIFQEYPEGIVSLVGDSYDIYNFTENIIGGRFREQILARNGKVVVRPDSGNPESVTHRVLEILGEKFGATTNTKGYKVLNPKVGVLWGDGIDINGIRDILDYMQVRGWAADNLVFGMGGGLLQKVNRDTQRFAFKSSAQKRDGTWYDVFKDPLEGGKTSKKGRLALVAKEGKMTTVLESEAGQYGVDQLQTVFENGFIMKEYSFADVRNNAKMV